jgi:ribosome maturation factor RimP
LEEKILSLIEPAAADLGYRIVRIRMSGLRRKTLQIMGERISDGGMGIEDCEALSRAVAPVLDAHDPIKDEYNLEVSSPGIDRPLVRVEDFERFIGHDVKLETIAMIDGRRRFKGVIAGAADGRVHIQTPEGRAELAFGEIREARLVLTDRLIEEDLRRARAADDRDQRAPAALSMPTEDAAPASPPRAAAKPGGKKPTTKPTKRTDS